MSIDQQIGVFDALALRNYLDTFTDQELSVLCFDGDGASVRLEEHILSDGSTVQNIRIVTV